mgnify:CR=1 FL=1
MTYKFRRNTTIGQLDAETDSFLESCFVTTDIYSILCDFDDKNSFIKRVIVGRTGSGKTALLKKISTDTTVKKYDQIEAESTVFEHINNNVYVLELMRHGVDLRAFYKSLWLHVLLVKAIETRFSVQSSFFEQIESMFQKTKRKGKFYEAHQYVETFKDHFFNPIIISEITSKFETALSAEVGFFSGAAAKGGLTAENIEKIQTSTSRYVSTELLRKQKELIKWLSEESTDSKIHTIISIDDLDRSWLSASKIRYDFINALLDAIKEFVNFQGIKFLVSIRTDILMGIYRNNLRQEEKDKSFILPITWSREEIVNLLDKRIDYLIKNQYAGKETVHFTDVFNFNVQGKPAIDFVLERTMLRPRDAIDFVNLSLAQAADSSVELDEDAVILAEENFYNSRKAALGKEWFSLYPHIQDYIDSLNYIKTREFSIAGISKEIKNEIVTFLSDRTQKDDNDSEHTKISIEFEELVKVWFTVGVIGIKKNEHLSVYSSFDKPDLDISDMNKNFVIHPLFFRP